MEQGIKLMYHLFNECQKKRLPKRSNNIDERRRHNYHQRLSPLLFFVPNNSKKAIRFLKVNEMFIIKHYIVVLGVQQQWRRVSWINLKNNNGIGFPSLSHD